jgi:hypothetical protein
MTYISMSIYPPVFIRSLVFELSFAAAERQEIDVILVLGQEQNTRKAAFAKDH